MNLNFYNLPTGDLPYDDIQLCKRMMLRLYEQVPFLPELPLINPNDEIFHKTIENFPCINFNEGKMFIEDNNDNKLMQTVDLMNEIYNSEPPYDLDMLSTDTPFFNMYIEILKRIKPKHTVINLVGPFTLCNSIINKNAGSILSDKLYRKFITYLITIKALWYITKIKQASPTTRPIIMFDESKLIRFGTLKRTHEKIDTETINTMFVKIFSKLRNEGAYIGVKSFDKCNWQLIIDTNCVDIISFDAYNHPTSLNILAPSINNFIAKGGYINWGIVPVMNENAIRSLNVNTIYNRFNSTIDTLSSQGVSMDLLLKHSTVSVQGNLSKYPILYAEKSILTANSLANKVFDKHK